MFGRKGLNPAPKRVSTMEELAEAQGHIASLDHAHVAGEMFFELCYKQLAQGGDAVGIEDFIGLLASAGGVACIATSLIEWEFVRMGPFEGDPILEQQIGGKTYFCGDLPTRYLYESQFSLLNIALPYAMKHGAAIEHDFLHEPVAHAMKTVGTPQFGVPRLPAANRLNAKPLELARTAWPQADHLFDTVQLALQFRPAALGFAIGKAFDTAGTVIDPLVMATIAVECAVPMSMSDPHQFWGDRQRLKANAA
ncbi:MAG: hypothetical protein EAY70_03315 [Sphingomonadales bacterium]|nr:MAG: hypothetical protein EAY70_03315 [Sphingomonadales bacterium]